MMTELIGNGGFWLAFYVIHGLLAILAASMLSKKVPEDQTGAVIILSLLSLFVPLIGELLGYLVFRLSERFKSEQLMEEYESLISVNVVNHESLRFEAVTNSELMPLSEVIMNGAPEMRKQVILRHIGSVTSKEGKYLKMGMQEKQDHETVHYAATTMNLLLDRYEKELKEAKKQALSGDSEALRRLSEVYKRYIGSELLTDVILKQKISEWTGMLNRTLAKLPDENWAYLDLYEVQEQAGNDEESVRILEAAIRRFPDQPEAYIRLVQHYFKRNNWRQLGRICKRMQTLFSLDQIPGEYRFMFEQLGGNEKWRKSLSSDS